MRRWQSILAIAGLLLLLVGAGIIRHASLPQRTALLMAGSCRTPATIVNPPAGTNTIGTAILLHGLGANRRTMTYLGASLAGLGLRVYLVDLPGHGDNEEPFTFAAAEDCADATVESLIRSREIDPAKTIVVGHSMSGAIAVRMADVEPVAGTIAISPAPLVPPHRMPSDLLIFSGGWDLWPMKRQAQALISAAGGERTNPSDFSERRAVKLQIVPHATHTSLITDSRVAHATALWALQTLFPRVSGTTLEQNVNNSTPGRGSLRLVGSLLGFVGLILIFPACVLLAASAADSVSAEFTPAAHHLHPSYPLLIAEQSVCAVASVMILALVQPLRFLHMYNGAYLASLLLLSGALLLALNWNYVRPNVDSNLRPLIAAAALAFAVFLALGAWINWQVADLWMNAPRWLRFGALLPVCFLFCFAEEISLGPVRAGKHRATRFAAFLVMRLELWLAVLLAYYELNNGQVLIGVLVTGLAIFSILQRLGGDALRKRTGSALAAAVFDAILASWFIAAVFPLT